MEKKIVLVSALEPWSMNNNVGAPSLYETLKGYSDAGYDIDYLTFNKNERLKNVSHGQNIDLDLPHLNTIRVDQKSGPRILGSRLTMKLNRLFFYPDSLLKGLKNYLEQAKSSPDILYGYEEQAVYAISKLPAKLKKNVKIVHRFQGTILGKNYNRLLSGLRKYETYRALKLKANLYVMTNDGTFGDEAIKYLNEDVNDSNLLFPRNGFNFEQFNKDHDREQVIKRLGFDPDGIYAFTVSRLTYWKRVDRAIGLIETFHEQYPKLRLLIVGEGEHKENLQEMVKRKGLGNKVHFLGGMGREDVAELMGSLDLFLSLYDVSNLGNPLFEAMISGQCIVTLDNGTTGQVIQHNENGIIVPPEDKELLEKEFENLLNNTEKRIRLKQSARKWADENLHSWSDRMKKEIAWIENH